MEDIEISFKHLMYSIIKKWRSILLAMIVLALVLDAYAVVKSISDKEQDSYVDTTSYLENLDKESREEVEVYATTYISYNNLYNAATDYVDQSIRMKINPSAVSTYELQYYVKSKEKIANDINSESEIETNIIQAYVGKISNQEVYTKICQATGWKNSTNYIEELISVNADKSAEITAGKEKVSGTFTITLQSMDKVSVEAMAEILKAVMEESKDGIHEIYGDFDIVLQNENYYIEANTSLMSEQQTRLATVTNVKKLIDTFEVDFKGNQLAYYNALVNNATLDAKAKKKAEIEENSSEEEINTTSVSYINIKFIVVGLALGMFLSVCWIALAYIVSKTIRTKDDMSDAFGISVLGTVRMASTKKKLCRGVDKLVDKIFYGKGPQFSEDERLAMICAGVRISAEKGDFKTVFVTGSCNDSETERIKDAIFTALRDADVKIKLGGSMVYDPESLEEMSASDGVVLVERTGYSLYEDILREKELCEKYDVPMIGGVVLE